MMQTFEELVARVRQTQNGFTDIKKAADEVLAEHRPEECIALAKQLFASEVHQARMVAVFIFGNLAADSGVCFQFLRDVVSEDADWRVQEILAQAFEKYCSQVGYEKALPTIRAWLSAANPNLRRAASEGPRIWTSKPYFREHSEEAIALLSPLRDDDSEYVRKSVGNALRDISRKHKDLIKAEVEKWDTHDKRVAQTYKLASKFL